MGEIIDDIIRASTVSGLRARPNEALGPIVVAQLDKLFAHSGPGALWERLEDSVGIQNDQSWRWIGEYLGSRKCVVVFSPRQELAAVEIEDGSKLVGILEQCIGFEFYVTDLAYTFLLCFNHHEFLIAAGDAKVWLQEKMRKHG